jgi:hypothetical protein
MPPGGNVASRGRIALALLGFAMGRSSAPRRVAPRPFIALALLGLGMGLSGCLEEMSPGWRIEDARLIGTRVQVRGDAGRAWPRPGETVEAELLLAEPPYGDLAPPNLGWVVLACVPSARSTPGMPSCAGAPVPVFGDGRPVRFSLAVPPAAVLGGTRELTLLALVCAGGSPALTDDALGCTDGARALRLVDRVTLATEPADAATPPNRRPTLVDEPVVLTAPGADPVVWELAAEPLLEAGCAAAAGGAAMPTLRAGGPEVELRLFASDDDREWFTVRVGDLEEARREVLTLSSFVSAGRLARQFTIVEGPDGTGREGFALAYTPPETAAPDGTPVRFWLVARDGRGGTDVAVRALCITP